MEDSIKNILDLIWIGSPVNSSKNTSNNLLVDASQKYNIIIDESPTNNISINNTSTSLNNDPFDFVSMPSPIKLFDPSESNNNSKNMTDTINDIYKHYGLEPANQLVQSRPIDLIEQTNFNIQRNISDTSNLTPDIINEFNSLDMYNYDAMFSIYSDPTRVNQLGKYLESKYISNPDYIAKLTESGNSNLVQPFYKLYFKLTKQSYSSKGYQYHQGLNIDPRSFNPKGWCSGGGFYFCELKNLHQFKNFGDYLTPILIPVNTPVYHEVWTGNDSEINTKRYNKYKAPMVYTLPRWNLTSPSAKVFFDCNKFGMKKWDSNLFYKSFYAMQSNKNLIQYNEHNNLLYYNNVSLYSYPAYFQREIILNYLIKKIQFDKYDIPQHVIMDRSGYDDIQKYYFKELIKRKDKKILNWLINYYFPYKIKSETTRQVSSKLYKPILSIDLNAENYLKKFTKGIKELLSKYDAVIAGSYVIQDIFNLSYYPNDIDIYISSSLKKQFIEELTKADSYFKLTRQTKDFSFTHQYNMTGVDSVYSLTENTIRNINEGTWYTSGNVFQVIFVNTLQPYDFITDNFDFDICTSSFDFASKKFRIKYTKNQGFQNMRIQDSYINKMTGTDTDSYSNYRANKTIERMCKYIERGFTIENWKEFLIEIRDKMCKD